MEIEIKDANGDIQTVYVPDEIEQGQVVTELQSLLTELRLKADLTETQPVSLSGVSTASLQSTIITALGTILTELQDKLESGQSVNVNTISGFGLEATLQSILSKIIASPSTEAKQDTLIAKDFATQTTLATILAKIISAPSTEAKQDTTLTAIQALLTDTQLRATPLNINLPAGSGVTGAAGLSAINTDLLTNTVNGWYDASAFQSGTIQIIASAGISAGQIFFEQTNDNGSTVGIPLAVTEVSSINSNPIIVATAITASQNRIFRFGLNARYVRVRISTAFVGGTLQARGFFSNFPYSSPIIYVQQATAANLNATVTGTVTATVASTTANIGTNGMSAFADSVANLGISATFTGTSRDGGATQAFARFVAKAFSDQAGTFRIEQSADNTNWRRATADVAVVANTPVELSCFATARYHRVIYINGGVAQTIFIINSAYLRI